MRYLNQTTAGPYFQRAESNLHDSRRMALDSLRDEWRTLYCQTLPGLAKSHDPAQPKWPVTLDHCFARIILDNTVGKGQQQWDKVIAKPAIKHMDEGQLRDAIDLGKQIMAGKANLCHLHELSLRCRDKNERKYATNPSRQSATVEEHSKPPGKRAPSDGTNYFEEPAKKRLKQNKIQSTLQFEPTVVAPDRTPATTNVLEVEDTEQLKKTLHRIQAHATLTPYRKRLYTVRGPFSETLWHHNMNVSALPCICRYSFLMNLRCFCPYQKVAIQPMPPCPTT